MSNELNAEELFFYQKVFEFAYNLGLSDKSEGLYLVPKEVSRHSLNNIINELNERRGGF